MVNIFMSIIIHDSTPLIFIHIPKTAGRSITETIKTKFGTDVIPNTRTKNSNYHSTIKDAEDFVGNLDHYCCFTVVRNPWDRMASWFNFRKNILQASLKQMRKTGTARKVSYLTADEIFRELEVMELGLYQWLVEYKDRPWDYTWFSPTTTQCEWIRDRKIDTIIKYENLQHEINQLKIFRDLTLKELNVSSNKKSSYQQLYNKNSRNLIAQIYQEDIDKFEYTFD